MTAPTPEDAVRTLPARVSSRIDFAPAGCWTWSGATRNGYGAFWLDRRVEYVHRHIYRCLVAEVPSGTQLDHTCFRRDCVNPAHLRLVTNKQNQEHRRGPQGNNTSGARGVFKDARSGKWYVQVGHNGERLYGGRFDNVKDANRAAEELRASVFTHDDWKAGL